MWRARYRSLHVGGLARLCGQECDAGKRKWHLCFRSALELETGTNHFLVAARVEFRVEFRRRRELRSDCSDSCRLRRAKARTQNIAPLSSEGVSQMGGSWHSSVQEMTSSCEGFEV